MTEVYMAEYTGDNWQSVFPSSEAEFSQLHPSFQDAMDYIYKTAGKSKVIAANISVFEDVPVNEDQEIEHSFLHFDEGTSIFTIQKWFEDQSPTNA